MKKIFSLVTAILFWSIFSQAQECTKCLPSSADYTFLGIDYTFVNFDKSEVESDNKIIETYIPAWNNLFELEKAKYDVGKSMKLEHVDYDISFFEKSNAKIKSVKNKENIGIDYVKNYINKLKFNKIKTQYAIFLIATNYSKSIEKATHYFCIYDVKNNKIVVLEKFDTKPGGFGFRNYWAGSFYNILKKESGSFKSWIK